MKWVILWAVVITNSLWAQNPGDQWPGLKVRNIVKGGEESLVAPGQVTLINLWATWCDACKIEISEMASEFKEFEVHAKFRLALVSLDKDAKKAEAWIAKEVSQSAYFKNSLYSDPEFRVADALKADAFPITVLIDQQGKIAHVQRGYKSGEGSTQKLAKMIRELLAK